MTTKAKYTYGRHTFTDVALEGIQGDAGSIANVLTLATEELKDAIQRLFQRQFSSRGRGVLGKISTNATSATLTLYGRDQTGHGIGSDYLTPGQKIYVGTEVAIKAGTADAVTVLTVNSDTSITVDSSITVVQDDWITNQQVRDSVAVLYNEMSGIMNLLDNTATGALDGIVPDTNFQGLARATNARVNANMYKPAAYEVLSLARLQEYYMKARKYGKPDLIRMNSDLYTKYGALLNTDKRFVNTMDLGGGFVGLEFASGSNPVPVVLDFDCDEQSAEILDTKTFTYGEMAPIGFVDRDGQVIRNVGGNSANFTAIMRAY